MNYLPHFIVEMHGHDGRDVRDMQKKYEKPELVEYEVLNKLTSQAPSNADDAQIVNGGG